MKKLKKNYLQNLIDYSNFDQEKFDNTLKCSYCDCQFNHPHNDRCIILNEIVDKEKLLYILNNDNFDQEVNNLAKNYYDSLDNLGRKRGVYKQKFNYKNRYYGVGSCLSYLKKKLEIALCRII